MSKNFQLFGGTSWRGRVTRRWWFFSPLLTLSACCRLSSLLQRKQDKGKQSQGRNGVGQEKHELYSLSSYYSQILRCSWTRVCTLRSCSVQLCCHLSSNLERIIKPTFSKCGSAPKWSLAFLEKWVLLRRLLEFYCSDTSKRGPVSCNMHRKAYLDKKLWAAPTTKQIQEAQRENMGTMHRWKETIVFFFFFHFYSCRMWAGTKYLLSIISWHGVAKIVGNLSEASKTPTRDTLFQAHLPARYLSREEEEPRLQPNKSQSRRVASTRARIQRSWTTAGSLSAQALRTSMLLPFFFFYSSCTSWDSSMWLPEGRCSGKCAAQGRVVSSKSSSSSSSNRWIAAVPRGALLRPQPMSALPRVEKCVGRSVYVCERTSRLRFIEFWKMVCVCECVCA